MYILNAGKLLWQNDVSVAHKIKSPGVNPS